MKYRVLALTLTLLVATLFLAACNNGSDPALISTSLSPSPSPSVSPLASPTQSATPTPAATPVEVGVVGEVDPTLGETFKQLADQSVLVVRGKFVEKLKEPYNQVRDANEPEKPDPKEKILEWQFILEVSDVYKTSAKGDEIKKGDKITVNLAYEENYFMTNYKPKTNPEYFEPDLNQDIVLFLLQDTDNKKIFYPGAQPFYFDVKDDRLYPRSNSKDTIAQFNKGMKLDEGEGAPVANLKKDLGVK